MYLSKKAREFSEQMVQDSAWAEEAKAKVVEGFSEIQTFIIESAKAQGIELTEDDICEKAPAGTELEEAELETVTGGAKCGCVLGGGGDYDCMTPEGKQDEIFCVCSVIGSGQSTSTPLPFMADKVHMVCAGIGAPTEYAFGCKEV